MNLLLVLHSFINGQSLALECLHRLGSNNKIVKDMVPTGGMLYLLNIFVNGKSSNTRQKSAEVLAKLCADKLTGQSIRLRLIRFLPPAIIDAMKENAEAAVMTFESTQENPELIWNDEARQRVSIAIGSMADKLFAKQTKPDGADQKWAMIEDLTEAGVKDIREPTSTLYSTFGSQNELVICGVFIRLFISNPGWVLRKPKEFQVELFETWSDLANRKVKDGDNLEQLTQALTQLFKAQPQLLENVPTMGVLPQVLQALCSKSNAIVGSGLNVLGEIVNSESCLKSLSGSDSIAKIKEAAERRFDLMPLIADTLSKMFANASVVDEFVAQVNFGLTALYSTHRIYFSGKLSTNPFLLILKKFLVQKTISIYIFHEI